MENGAGHPPDDGRCSMSGLFFLFWSAFVAALSGALMPGPVLTATISEVMKRGFKAGPLIVVGHAILELTLLAAVVGGLGVWIQRNVVMGALGIGGGMVLLIMGAQMALTAGAAADQALHAKADSRSAIRGPALTGILTSLSNPYWALWWATTGLCLVSLALKNGLLGLVSFYCGHVLADLAWYSLVALAVSSGRRLCPRTVYVGLIISCGIVLAGLGVYFFKTGVTRLI
jgi:threonine/homoserine/homoserine lactone efflux protein